MVIGQFIAESVLDFKKLGLVYIRHSQFGLGVYKRCLEHNDYAKQLKKSVIEFGINNLK